MLELLLVALSSGERFCPHDHTELGAFLSLPARVCGVMAACVHTMTAQVYPETRAGCCFGIRRVAVLGGMTAHGAGRACHGNGAYRGPNPCPDLRFEAEDETTQYKGGVESKDSCFRCARS